jgi:hypothetical protein
MNFLETRVFHRLGRGDVSDAQLAEFVTKLHLLTERVRAIETAWRDTDGYPDTQDERGKIEGAIAQAVAASHALETAINPDPDPDKG